MTPPAPQRQDPALEFHDVTVPSLRDPGVIIMEGVQWTVSTGDYWAIGGLNRTGKSDLMALAAGIMRPARGSLRLFGQETGVVLENEFHDGKRPINLVFDGGQLLNHLTLGENVALPLLYHLPPGQPPPAERIRALIELTGLAGAADQRPAEVSRNSQQRFGLARALALPPQILLLDSPLTGLDPRDATWWLDLIDELSAGHPIVGHPLTLVVTADDLRPWIERARQFALIQHRRFLPLGSRSAALQHGEPLLQDLLRRGAPPGPSS